ncbi:NUDIX hydrolase [Parerythrobacter jejuensis]|uniref:NUDIX domain-containing protein n=1 Tax=Parerythrobacter jejuensis TaxID=795812 RepID=A0A845AJD5_9SPHN|nr:NUDIX domain-containing protein [Parerythrobacter jejuensis]MXP30370.1 NUDIX domain-containing protein [Parerythrobacter jejuensis]MXP33130.1 NUDIX domain-containing protein [Parerythrobacter jejuensis]
MLHLIPRPLARTLLRLAYAVRHRWRMLRKTHLAGVSIIIRDANGQVLLVRHAYGPAVWMLPGGGLSRGEDPAGAARREAREELAIELLDLQECGTMEETISGCPHTSYIFSARAGSEPRQDGREVVDWAFFAPAHIPTDLGRLTRKHLALVPGF